MTLHVAFPISAAAVVAVSLGVSALLAVPLRQVLVDLTGARHRATLWLRIAGTMIVLVPLVFLLFAFSFSRRDDELLDQVIHQCRWALIGLIVALSAISGVLIVFIRSLPPRERRPELYSSESP